MIIVCCSGDNSTSTARLLPLTSDTFSSPIFAARQTGVSPSASRADMSALKTLTRARRRGREGRPVGWEWVVEEGGREGERERERRREKENKMIQHNWYRHYTPPFTAMWMSKSPSVFLSLFTSNTKTCEKNNQLFSSWYNILQQLFQTWHVQLISSLAYKLTSLWHSLCF